MSDEEENSWEQKKKLHAMIGDISKQLTFLGQKWSKAEWKFFIFASAHGQELIPNLFGPGLIATNRKRVTGLPMPTMSDLIMQVQVYGDERNVRWSDPEYQAMMAEAEARN